MWQCSNCREKVDDGFEVCWNCGTSSDGVPDPEFRRAEPLDEEDTQPWTPVNRPVDAESTDIRALAPDPTLTPRCPHCGGAHLYSRRVASGSGEGPYLLAGLGGFFHFAQFDVVVCARCGLTQLFAEPAAREKLRSTTGLGKAVGHPQGEVSSLSRRPTGGGTLRDLRELVQLMAGAV
jgi:hypothetical protein